MKTTFFLRVLVTVAVITTTSCNDPFEETTRPPFKGNNQQPTTEFYTTVTTWNRAADDSYIGLVSTTPSTDLSKVQLYAIKNGQRMSIDNYGVVSDRPAFPIVHDDYIWANVQNNVLLLNYKSSTSTSRPPFPLEVIIVY